MLEMYGMNLNLTSMLDKAAACRIAERLVYLGMVSAAIYPSGKWKDGTAAERESHTR